MAGSLLDGFLRRFQNFFGGIEGCLVGVPVKSWIVTNL